MKRNLFTLTLFAIALLAVVTVLYAAEVVPTDVQEPGTQPGEVGSLESLDRCDNCHGGYDQAVEPTYNWQGSMMGHAGRDPMLWATMAIAEQGFDVVGDLCLRCHLADGWIDGNSTPTDGSAMQDKNGPGVNCDLCHTLTNPDDSEWLGEQFSPYIANDGGNPPEGYYGGAQYVLWDGSDKLGPYNDADARRQWLQSDYHRSPELYGTCHDVSNPVTGDLAHNFGAQVPLDAGTYSGVPGAPVDEKAAFNNFPYAYGIVERTFSEHMASADGAYGTLNVTLDGTSYQVNSILDLHDPNTKIYEAHGAITQEWASELIDLGLAASTPVEFDRIDGTVLVTLGDVAAQDPGTYHESFHFALNNHLAKDNRLPPYGFSYDEAKTRNTLPVPETQYGDPGTGGTYDYWDSIALSPPSGATYAYVDLVYQPTSWEYIQFLYLANDGSVTFLADGGSKLFDAWLATGMADPVVMTSATWGTPPA